MPISQPLALLNLVHIVPTSLIPSTLTLVGKCVLYMYLRDSHREYIDQLPVGCQPIAMKKWCEEHKIPMSCYHYLLLKYELLVLQFVRSVRSGNKSLYLTVLAKIMHVVCLKPCLLRKMESCAYTWHDHATSNAP